MVNEINESNQLLPVGSVVYLKDGTIRLVILAVGQLVSSEDNDLPVFYDYLAGLYPQGFDENHMYYFNSEDIDEVSFSGLNDSESKRYQNVISKWEKDNQGKYRKLESRGLDDEKKSGFGF